MSITGVCSRKGIDADDLINATVSQIMKKLKDQHKKQKPIRPLAVILCSELDASNDLMVVSPNRITKVEDVVGVYQLPERELVEGDLRAFYGE